MTESNPHHLVLGKLNDFITGEVLPDTYDERYRQKIAKLLVKNSGFQKENILKDHRVVVTAGNQKAYLNVDFLVEFRNKIIIFIKFAPGSLVTRRLSSLALSRIIRPYQIPYVVITNGEDAEILDGNTGKIIKTGLENLPVITEVEKEFYSFTFKTIEKPVFEQATRIAYACEVDGACPCDTDICIIK